MNGVNLSLQKIFQRNISKGKSFVFDIETEGLINPQKLWVCVFKDIETKEIFKFTLCHEDPEPLKLFLSQPLEKLIGHNILSYDIPVVERILGITIPKDILIDTLIISRLLNYNIPKGHSLESWGERLKFPKHNFNDFSCLSQSMIDYCVQDVEVTLRLYTLFKPYIDNPDWKSSIDIEHKMAYICNKIHNNGFYFNLERALELHKEINEKIEILDKIIFDEFKPKAKLIREINPRATKHGTIHLQDFRWLNTNDLTPYSVGSPFSLIEFEEFNPASPKQIVERLNKAGWKPTEKTKGHIEALKDKTTPRDKILHYKQYGWKVSEENLNTLPQSAPEATRKLAERIVLAHRRSTLEEWINATGEDQRIHGNIFSIGSWTHRCSHNSPNTANIVREIKDNGEPTLYGKDFRSLWMVPRDRYLIGVDADGIQLRVLAHYLQDERFTEALIKGDKKLKTDIHSLNQKALGADICKDRNGAKTFIYAWVLGAALPKIAQILETNIEGARTAVNNIQDFYPGLKDLRQKRIPFDAARGYFIGFDGRKVVCDDTHLMLAGYLQNGESIVMKYANVLWDYELQEKRLPYWQVNFVHDEWQTETIKELDIAKEIAYIQARSIQQSGEYLKLNCPFAGSVLNAHNELAIGINWSETH